MMTTSFFKGYRCWNCGQQVFPKAVGRCECGRGVLLAQLQNVKFGVIGVGFMGELP